MVVLRKSFTKVWLTNIYYNDRNNSIFDTYNNYRDIELEDNIENFKNIILKDNVFLKDIFEEQKEYIKDDLIELINNL